MDSDDDNQFANHGGEALDINQDFDSEDEDELEEGSEEEEMPQPQMRNQ